MLRWVPPRSPRAMPDQSDPRSANNAQTPPTSIAPTPRKRICVDQMAPARSAALAPLVNCGEQSGITVEQPPRVDRNRDVPRDCAAGEHEHGDIEPHDVADAEQRRREIRADVRDSARTDVGCGLRRAAPELEPRLRELHEAARDRRPREILGAALRVVAALQHLRGRRALRERELLLDDQRATQRDREHHAEQPAEAGDHAHPNIVERAPVAEDHERREREDHAGRERLARGRARLHDVVLEDVGLFEKPQHGHRDHRGRNRRGHREPREHAEVRVRAGEHGGKQHAEHERLDGELRKQCAFSFALLRTQ